MRILSVVLSVTAILLTVAPAPAKQTGSEAQAAAMAEKFLAAMGGREVWAQATYVHSKAVNHHPQARLPYIQEYWTDFRKPRTLNRLTNFDMDRLRGFNVDHGWGIKEGETYEYDAERVANELRDWRRSIYAKLVAIARRDKSMGMEWRNGRLSFSKDGEDLGWIELGPDGAPKGYSATAEGAPTSFGPLETFGEINWPRSGEQESGWRFEMLSIELGTGTVPVSFEMPKDLENIDP